MEIVLPFCGCSILLSALLLLLLLVVVVVFHYVHYQSKVCDQWDLKKNKLLILFSKHALHYVTILKCYKIFPFQINAVLLNFLFFLFRKMYHGFLGGPKRFLSKNCTTKCLNGSVLLYIVIIWSLFLILLIMFNYFYLLVWPIIFDLVMSNTIFDLNKINWFRYYYMKQPPPPPPPW